jgi:hypothetical protein
MMKRGPVGAPAGRERAGHQVLQNEIRAKPPPQEPWGPPCDPLTHHDGLKGR